MQREAYELEVKTEIFDASKIWPAEGLEKDTDRV